MAPDRKIEIENAIIRAMSAFGIDSSLPYQTMSFLGLKEMRRDIPLDEFVEVLLSMEGFTRVEETGVVMLPISHFTK